MNYEIMWEELKQKIIDLAEFEMLTEDGYEKDYDDEYGRIHTAWEVLEILLEIENNLHKGK